MASALAPVYDSTEALGLVMAGTITRPRPRDTWEDWLPDDAPDPGEYLTRDELAERLTAMGADVGADDFRHWEAVGALPKTVRRWHDGATRAVYPDWFIPLVIGLRELQATKMSLADIGPALRDAFEESLTRRQNESDFNDVLARMIAREVFRQLVAPAVHAFHETYTRLTKEDVMHLRIDFTVVPDGVAGDVVRAISFHTRGPD